MSDTEQIEDMSDQEFAAYMGQLDEKIQDNYDNDGDEDEHAALLEEKYAARKQHEDAKKERDTRQQSNRDDLKKLTAEATMLEAKLAEGVPPDDEADLRARQAFLETRRGDLEAALPYAGITTENLLAQREAGELEREDARLAYEAAVANRGEQSVLARKLKAELDVIREREARVSVELQNRELQQQNIALGHQRAVAHAERELRDEDARAISEADEGRRGTKAEDLAESFAARLELRIPVVEARLWRAAEVSVGRALLSPSNAVEPLAPAREDKLREDEKKIEQERIRQEQAQQRQGRVQPRSWPIRAERESR